VNKKIFKKIFGFFFISCMNAKENMNTNLVASMLLFVLTHKLWVTISYVFISYVFINHDSVSFQFTCHLLGNMTQNIAFFIFQLVCRRKAINSRNNDTVYIHLLRVDDNQLPHTHDSNWSEHYSFSTIIIIICWSMNAEGYYITELHIICFIENGININPVTSSREH
jgi:hypothetical protein